MFDLDSPPLKPSTCHGNTVSKAGGPCPSLPTLPPNLLGLIEGLLRKSFRSALSDFLLCVFILQTSSRPLSSLSSDSVSQHVSALKKSSFVIWITKALWRRTRASVLENLHIYYRYIYI